MAEIRFDIIAVTAELKQKSILAEFTLDVDEDTVNSSSVIVLNTSNNTVELYDAVVDGRIIQLKLHNDPQPNDTYTLLVQGTVESIVGDKMDSAFLRELSFSSEVTSEVSLLSPANFEKINALKLEWKEIGDTLTNSIQWQIAKENAFYNIVYTTTVNDATSIELPAIESGQYYIRGRAVKGDEYGRWSEITTFIFNKPAETTEPSTPGGDTTTEPTEPTEPVEPSDPSVVPPTEDPDDPIIIVEEEIKLEDSPDSGTTPKEAFSFAFSEDIDISNAEIKIYRSDF